VSARPDREEIIRCFAGSGVAFFDDLLTPPAFSQLRRFLLESTIWHDFTHIDGFVASYLEDGLACPLLLQVAEEGGAPFPEMLGQNRLSQAWAFKAVQPLAAVDAHADAGAVSINFWMTRTDANLNTARGGLLVCPVPPPDEWVINDYQGDRKWIVTFLEQQ